MADIGIEIKGLKELQLISEKAAMNYGVIGGPAGRALTKSALLIERQAKLNATGIPTNPGQRGPNVQTGRLRSSITIDVDKSNPMTWARVGTNVSYAPSVEFGHRQEVGRFVPISGASRIRRGEFKGRYAMHGLGMRLVNPTAPAYPFFFPAVNSTSGERQAMLVVAAREMESEWGRGGMGIA